MSLGGGIGDFGDFAAVNASEQSDASDMQGAASQMNTGTGASVVGTPVAMLAALWVLALASYWALGYLFKGQTS